ncbi:MAG: acyl-CoA dehydrogenase family protein [Acidobacteriota bacterium]
MDFGFSTEQEMLRNAVREFAEGIIAPRVAEMEATDEVPMNIIKEMCKMGFMGVEVPREYSGTSMGAVARMIIVEELGRVSAAMGMAYQCYTFGMGGIVDFGSDELKSKYLPRLAAGELLAAGAITESTGGSDPTGIETKAVQEGDTWVINGRKVFITNSHCCDVAMVIARTEEEPRKFTAFMAEKEQGFKGGKKEQKIGFKGCCTGEMVFENCRVPAENIIGDVGKGLPIALSCIGNYGRLGMAGVSLGIARAALEEAIKFSNERVVSGKPISSLPTIYNRIADIHCLVESASMLAYKAAWLRDAGQKSDVALAAAKLYCTEAADTCTRLAMDIHGGYGCMKEYKIERLVRDAKLCLPADGTSDIQRVVIGKTLTAKKK